MTQSWFKLDDQPLCDSRKDCVLSSNYDFWVVWKPLWEAQSLYPDCAWLKWEVYYKRAIVILHVC